MKQMKTNNVFWGIIAVFAALSLFFLISYSFNRSLIVSAMRHFSGYTQARKYTRALLYMPSDFRRSYNDSLETLMITQDAYNLVAGLYPIDIKSVSFVYQTTSDSQWRPLSDGTSVKGITYVKPVLKFNPKSKTTSEENSDLTLGVEYNYNWTWVSSKKGTVSRSVANKADFEPLGDDSGSFFEPGEKVRAEISYQGRFLASASVELK